ncbi:NADPH-dependent F420 reductase [Telluribacter humicola]|uniref:NADPH-dependent F420 reductase n=1 Tax=Telluribacter humicola TaxID=1720261 RepID=UPI001A979E5F|nr:NAD(P)-binding domain-containing protein [Telluribacter humicola]
MKIGIIGTGGIGQAFASHVARAGYEVLISNSRGPESLQAVAQQLGGNTRAVTTAEAAGADVLFLSVPWNKLAEVAGTLPSLAGRVVIDPTNAILPGFKPADLGGKTSSEVVAELLPGAKLVKAFNTLPVAILQADPREVGGSRVIFYSGNDSEAKHTLQELLTKTGFAGIDLGNLASGGKMQTFPGGPLATLNLIKKN